MAEKDSRKQFGQILVEAGLINQEQLKKALASKDKEKSLARVLVSLGMTSEKDIANVLAKQLGLSFIDLASYEINPGASTMVAEETARHYLALPINFDGDKLVVATSDPTNVFAMDDLRIVTGYAIKPVVCTETELLGAISQYSKMDKMVEEVVESVAEGVESTKEEVKEEKEAAEEAPIAKLVSLIVTEAVRSRANDVHIEPQEKDLRIRYRIDGVLHEAMRSPKKIQAGVVSRLKIMGGMDIAERRLPQDGRFSLAVDKRPIDFRMATLPTVYGEKVVLRILEKESVLYKLEDLGLPKEEYERFKQSYNRPYGAILVTGPTGCGKTTTLYAVLNILNAPEKNIISVEDPVEYRLPGINQVQVNPKAGLTFAAGLRSILRNDPDIVMVGEVRDQETALITVEAALTGHLVLSTLHTNDAPSALTRLTEMGIEPFLSSSAIDCVVAQRLARRLCESCKEAYKPPPKVLTEIGFPLSKNKAPVFYKAVGCSKCADTGFFGRVGVFEVMRVSEEIERLTVEKKMADEIGRVARREGMKTLLQDGLEKVAAGLTSLDEVMRVVV